MNGKGIFFLSHIKIIQQDIILLCNQDIFSQTKICLYIIVNFTVKYFYDKTDEANNPDPYARPEQKKQGRERKVKARKKDGWQDRSCKRRISPPKSHTPGRDHRKGFKSRINLSLFFGLSYYEEE